MKRIFYDGELKSIIDIDGDYFHYLKNVVRVKPNEVLGVLSSDEYGEYSVTELGKRSASLTLENKRPANRHAHKLKVYQCLLKREYMDFAIEKYTELCATEIIPVISDRSLNDLKDKTMQRYQDISVKAALQSENEQLPIISEAIDIKDVAADMQSNILFYERAEEQGDITPAAEMSIIIGPEGGFTDDEVAMLISKGFTAVKPIGSILKAETASVVFTGYVRILQESL